MTSDKDRKPKDKSSKAKGRTPTQASGEYVVRASRGKTTHTSRSKSESQRRIAETQTTEMYPEYKTTNSPAWMQAMLDVLNQHDDAWDDLSKGEVILEDRHGKPIAVVLDYQHFVALVEHLEDLLDAQSAREAFAALERGEEERIPWEEVKARLISEGLLDE